MRFKTAFLIFDSYFRIGVVLLLLPVLPIRRVIGMVQRLRAMRYSNLNEASRRALFLWANRLTYRVSRKPCLAHSIALYWMDEKADLAIGVRKVGEAIEGHAWIESEGLVLSSIETAPLTCLMRYRANGKLDVY